MPTSHSSPKAAPISFTRDEELELIAAAKSSSPGERERALTSLLSVGMPMITMFARLYASKLRYFVDYDDLTSAGCEGYLIAISRHNPDKNTKLSTYASWWVRNKMIAEVTHACWLMGIPERTYKKLIKFKACSNKLQANLGRQPTSTELAHDLNWSAKGVVHHDH